MGQGYRKSGFGPRHPSRDLRIHSNSYQIRQFNPHYSKKKPERGKPRACHNFPLFGKLRKNRPPNFPFMSQLDLWRRPNTTVAAQISSPVDLPSIVGSRSLIESVVVEKMAVGVSLNLSLSVLARCMTCVLSVFYNHQKTNCGF